MKYLLKYVFLNFLYKLSVTVYNVNVVNASECHAKMNIHFMSAFYESVAVFF